MVIKSKPVAKAAKSTKAELKASTVIPAQSNAFDVAAIKADIRSTMDAILANETGNVKLTQHIAWRILQYTETLSKPVPWSMMRDGGKMFTDWRTTMRLFLLGKAPSMKGAIDQSMRSASAKYKAETRIFDQAATFVVAVGCHGVTTEYFSETRNTFAIPGLCYIPLGFAAVYDLKDAIDNDAFVPVDNRTLTLSGRNKEGKSTFMDVRASVAQVLNVFKEKPAPANTAEAAAQAAKSGIGTAEVAVSSLDPVVLKQAATVPTVIKTVLSNAGIERLAIALLDAFNADPSVKMDRSMFDDKVWDALMSIGMRIAAMAQAADAASKANGKPAANKAA